MSEDPATQIRRALGSILMCWDDTMKPARRGEGSHVKTSKEPPMPISAHVLDVRAMCRARLGGWVRVILEEQDLKTVFYSSDVPALVDFLDTHADWLGDFEAGPDAAYEIDLSAQELRAIVTPHVKEWMKIGTCPLKYADEDGEQVVCGGQVRAYPDRDPKCQKCGIDGVVDWWERVMFPELGIMHKFVTAPELIVFLHRQIGRRVAAVTIRQWVTKGIIETAGKDPSGRNLYDKREVIKAFDSNGRAVGIGRHAEAV